MRSIAFDADSFIIDGVRRYLLIGTVNYFRMDPADWAHRLDLFKQSGFNTVDVYVAWGYHEASEGKIDFESPARDLDRYLTLCRERDLFVYFRPGPYICNEFDGGGLPPWLYHKPGVTIRENEPNYLAIVKRYLSRVNQIAAKHQHTRGGSIILYAIENELDFYPTKDVAGYMAALRDRVRADGIDVPLTACIGQRTPIERGMGLIDGVIPTPNIYVGGKDVEAESTKALKTLRATRSLTGKAYDVPPFVTEMDRGENSLRRIASVGFKGLGPFNFAGGSNWDRYHAVNNWGDYKQLTTTIDFGGMIRYDGVATQTFYNARQFARFIAAVEPEICVARPLENVATVESLEPIEPHVLASGETRFVFLPNLSDNATDATLKIDGKSIALRVPAKKTPIVTMNLPLKRLGVDAAIEICTGEFWTLERRGDRVVIEVIVREAAQIVIGGATVDVRAGETREVTIAGTRLAIVGLDDQSSRRGMFDTLELAPPTDLLSRDWVVDRSAADHAHHGGDVATRMNDAFTSLEANGVYYGTGVYETTLDLAWPASELSIDYAADVVATWIDGTFVGSQLADGNAWKLTMPLSAGRHTIRWRVTCWGRPCFHDAKWPAAKLGAPRGLVGSLRVDGTVIQSPWTFAPAPLPDSGPSLRTRGGATSGDQTARGNPGHEVEGGEAIVATHRLLHDHPRGAVLELAGEFFEVLVHLDGVGVGRLAFDPIFRFTGGSNDRIYLPGSLMKACAELTLTLRGTQPQRGRLSRVSLQSLVPEPVRA